MAHIHEAPNAFRLTRRETDFVTCRINRITHAVNPAVTKRFVQRFAVSGSLLVGAPLVKPDPQLRDTGVVRRKPSTKGFGRREMLDRCCPLVRHSAPSGL